MHRTALVSYHTYQYSLLFCLFVYFLCNSLFFLKLPNSEIGERKNWFLITCTSKSLKPITKSFVICFFYFLYFWLAYIKFVVYQYINRMNYVEISTQRGKSSKKSTNRKYLRGDNDNNVNTLIRIFFIYSFFTFFSQYFH